MSKDDKEIEDKEEESEEEKTEEKDEEEKSSEDDSKEKESEDEDSEDSKEKDDSEKESTSDKQEEDDSVTLPDGTKVTYQELVSGYMKDADYRRKTSELSRLRGQSLDSDKKSDKDEKKSDALSKYDAKQLEEFKTLASELGFMTKTQYEEMASHSTKQNAVETFFATHPEYTEQKDPTGVLYNALMEELKLYNTGNLKSLPKILEKAHAEVLGKFSSTSEKAKALANKERIKAAAIGSKGSGASKSKASDDNSEYTEAQLEVMRKMGVLDE